MSRSNKSKVTKFPVARIKRIMQKDDDVGKVAQATPVVISKALELFLALVVDEASKVTTSRGARRVEAYHLKHAINTTDTFDFLKELVENVPDPSAGGTLAESGAPARADPTDSGTEGAPPKRKRAPRKRAGTAAATAAAGANASADEDDEAEVKPKKARAPRRRKADGEESAAPRRRAAKGAGSRAKAKAPEVAPPEEAEMDEDEEDEEGDGPAEGHMRPGAVKEDDYEEEEPYDARAQTWVERPVQW